MKCFSKRVFILEMRIILINHLAGFVIINSSLKRLLLIKVVKVFLFHVVFLLHLQQFQLWQSVSIVIQLLEQILFIIAILCIKKKAPVFIGND